MVITCIDIIINCCNIIIALPCLEIGKRSFIPTPAIATLVPAKEESCYGTYSMTSTAISWGDDADYY